MAGLLMKRGCEGGVQNLTCIFWFYDFMVIFTGFSRFSMDFSGFLWSFYRFPQYFLRIS